MNAAMSIDAETLQAELPDAMRATPRWLLWKSIPNRDPGKKERKVPFYVNGQPRQGQLDTTADWSRLAAFDAALAAMERGGYTGLGFALGPDGSGACWQGIDLDGEEISRALRDALPGYVERSPSGKGVHAIGYGPHFPALGPNSTGIEAYAGGRYFTVTGAALGGDIEDLSGFVTGTLKPRHSPAKRTTERASDATPGDDDAAERVDQTTVAELRSALYHLRADDRDRWVRMGMALKTLGEIGRGLWLDWSATSEKFDPADAARVWESFKRDGLTHKAVFAAAKEQGWVNPKAKVVRIDSRRQQRHEAPPAPEIVRPPRGEWMDALIVKCRDDGTDDILCRTHNLILILDHADGWQGRIRYNEFSGSVTIDGKDMDDSSPIIVKADIERHWINDRVPKSDIVDALLVVANRHPYHPVRDYLEALEWDGIERIDSFLEDHFGCPRDEYHIAVARSLLISSVARIFKPGCKVDTMPILQSPQGYGKTKTWPALYGRDWCTEVSASLSDKDFYIGLRGVWAADFSELDAFSRAETTQIKRIITAQSDSYRPPYGQARQTFPRQGVFVGGTNRDDWNTDPTGARRFLPIQVRCEIDTDAIAAARDQLWAEAVARFRRGDIWWDIPNAHQHQDAVYQGDPWEEPILAFLHDRDQTTVAAVLGDCLRIETGKQNRADMMRVSAVLKRAGWERKRTARGWVYRPKRDVGPRFPT